MQCSGYGLKISADIKMLNDIAGGDLPDIKKENEDYEQHARS